MKNSVSYAVGLVLVLTCWWSTATVLAVGAATVRSTTLVRGGLEQDERKKHRSLKGKKKGNSLSSSSKKMKMMQSSVVVPALAPIMAPTTIVDPPPTLAPKICAQMNPQCGLTAAEAQLAYLSTYYDTLRTQLRDIADNSKKVAPAMKVGPLIKNGGNGGLIDIDIPLSSTGICEKNDKVECGVCADGTDPLIREAVVHVCVPMHTIGLIKYKFKCGIRTLEETIEVRKSYK